MKASFVRSVLERQKDGWQFARVDDTNQFIAYYVRNPSKGPAYFFIRTNAGNEMRIVVGNKNLGSIETVDDIKLRLVKYFKKGPDPLPKVLRGKDYELGDELKSLVLNYLRNELCEITFVKADNTKRVMLCTLNITFLPELGHHSSTAAEAKREHHPWLITVWDVEFMEWRSFKLERLLRVSYI